MLKNSFIMPGSIRPFTYLTAKGWMVPLRLPLQLGCPLSNELACICPGPSYTYIMLRVLITMISYK